MRVPLCTHAREEYDGHGFEIPKTQTPGGTKTGACGSKYLFNRYTLSPLAADSPELLQSFTKALRLNDGVSPCQGIMTLLTLCGGYPASIVAAIQQIREKAKGGFASNGFLATNVIQEVFARVVGHLENRYSERRWVEAITGSLPDSPLHFKELLQHVMLVSLSGSEVDRKSSVAKTKASITYDRLEITGLISLLPRADTANKLSTVVLPMLAVTIMNKYLQVVDMDVLDSPFVTGFSAHEKMGLVSLAARTRALAALRGPGSQCTLADLRPKSDIKYKHANKHLLINLPANVCVVQVGRRIQTGEAPVTGSSAGTPELADTDGTIWLAYTDEVGFDGKALFSGKFCD